jgi:hypothetical protein
MAAKEAVRPYHRRGRPENRPKDARPLPSHEIADLKNTLPLAEYLIFGDRIFFPYDNCGARGYN